MVLVSCNYKSSDWNIQLGILKMRQSVIHDTSFSYVAMISYSCWLTRCIKSHKYNKTITFGDTHVKQWLLHSCQYVDQL